MKLFDPVPPRTIPPNVLTAIAFGFGCSSAALSLSGGDTTTAAWFILLSALFDKLDGSVARLLHSQSEFGVQFDSFADCIAFGIAPAALVFRLASQAGSPWPVAAVAAISLVYAVFTAVRLARFNVTTSSIGPNLFLGLPSTLSGALVASTCLTGAELKLAPERMAQALPIMLLVNAALMVCNLPLPKIKFSTGNIAVRAFKVLSAVAIYLAVGLRMGFPVVLALLVGYVLVGFGWTGPRQLAADQGPATDPAEVA